MRSRGFTLLEIIIVISIIGILFVFSSPLFSGYTEAVRLNAGAKIAASNLRAAQNRAVSEHKTCSLTINNKTFVFSPSGACPPGGSGTLILSNKHHSRKIIVAPNGRIRIE